MDIIRESLTTIVDRYRYETAVEHFVMHGGMTPSDDDYNRVSPYFKEYGVAPQDAFNVLMNFDKDPVDLSKKDVESRVKMLNILLKMLNDPDTSEKILQNYGKDMPKDQKENVKSMLNLLKRLVKLLILEASPEYKMIENAPMIVIGIIVIIAAILFMRK